MLGKLRQAVSISEADVYVCACVGGGQAHVCWVSVNPLSVLLEGAVHFRSAVHSADLQMVTILCQQLTVEEVVQDHLEKLDGDPCVVQGSSPSG